MSLTITCNMNDVGESLSRSTKSLGFPGTHWDPLEHIGILWERLWKVDGYVLGPIMH